MSWRDDCSDVLEDVAENIQELARLENVKDVTRSNERRFSVRTKNILQDLRSPLDYAAVGLAKELNLEPPKRGKIYFPLADSSTSAQSTIHRYLPNLQQVSPEVYGAIESCQPYIPRNAWLRQLNKLNNDVKHTGLKLQLWRNTRFTQIVETETGRTVTWWGIKFEPGRTVSQGGGISLDCGPGQEREGMFEISKRSIYGTPLVFGIPIDPKTQLPAWNSGIQVKAREVSRHFFYEPHVPVVDTLTQFYGDMCHMAEKLSYVLT